MPEELVSAYDWTSSLETQMMENLHSGSQKVLLCNVQLSVSFLSFGVRLNGPPVAFFSIMLINKIDPSGCILSRSLRTQMSAFAGKLSRNIAEVPTLRGKPFFLLLRIAIVYLFFSMIKAMKRFTL